MDSVDADAEQPLVVDAPEPAAETPYPSAQQRRQNLVGLIVVAAIVIGLDHLTKWWAVEALSDEKIELVWTLQLRLLYNTGTAFSLGSSFGQWIAVLGIVVVVALVAMGRVAANRTAAMLIGLVVGGALGNLIDRAFRDADSWLGGRVVDFIDLQWWPVFNVADIAICVGGVLLVLHSLRHPPE